MPRYHFLVLTVCLILTTPLSAADLPKVKKVDLQPLAAQAKRVVEALDLLGSPLTDADKKALAAAKDVEAIQAILDKYCLAGVRLTPAGGLNPPQPILEIMAGPAKPELAEQGWRVFL